MSADTKPMARVEWQRKLRDLRHRCCFGAPGDEEKCFRSYQILLRRIPDGALMAGAVLLDTPDQLAAQSSPHGRMRNWTDTVLALLGPQAGFMLSRGPQGVYFATVALPGRTSEGISQGPTAALALLGAIAEALGEMVEVQPRKRPRNSPMVKGGSASLSKLSHDHAV